MLTLNNLPTEHQAHLGTGNGLVQFVCCSRVEQSFDVLWVAPGGSRPVNVWHSPRQAYDMVVRHLTHGQYDDETVRPTLEAAEALIEPSGDVRASIEHIAGQLDAVELTIRHD